MCTVLNADYLLATILSTKENVSFCSLLDVRSKIHASVGNVVVDISLPAVNAAIHYYPEIFEKRQNSIARAVGAERYLNSKYLEYEFTAAVPQNIHQEVIKAIAVSVP